MSNAAEAVLWLHADDGSSDSPVAEQLARDHRVVTQSASSASARAVAAISPPLGTFVLVGRSGAAETALALARSAGNACIGLILIAPVFAQLPAPETVPDVPMLLLLGTNDTLVPPNAAAALCAALPRAHPILIYAAGHELDRDRAEAVLAVMRDFIARREQFIVRNASDVIYP
jgi:pimeloyl-ACP methyl ester carboxylesterase